MLHAKLGYQNRMQKKKENVKKLSQVIKKREKQATHSVKPGLTKP
jgi:hypothetical protein